MIYWDFLLNNPRINNPNFTYDYTIDNPHYSTY
nr:MAG TPA: hypothetical protein [Caudoviricetes sp.]